MANMKKQNKFMKRSKDPPYKTVPSRKIFVMRWQIRPNFLRNPKKH